MRKVRPFSGFFFARSEESWTEEFRRPALVGFYIFIDIMAPSYIRPPSVLAGGRPS
jgi:hypothetical protein